VGADKRAKLEQGDGTGQLSGRSPLQAAALAVLLDQPGHGYDVAKRVNMRVGSPLEIQPKHIYGVLASLERVGVVRSHKESPSSPHGQTIFYPTELAERAWREWLVRPPQMTVVRKDIQTRLAFSSEADAPELLVALRGYRADLLEMIEKNAGVHAAPGASWGARVDGFTRAGADRRLKAELEWIEEICRELEAIISEQSR
jgi:DNA-binding PadR family transcriptional regulator